MIHRLKKLRVRYFPIETIPGKWHIENHERSRTGKPKKKRVPDSLYFYCTPPVKLTKI